MPEFSFFLFLCQRPGVKLKSGGDIIIPIKRIPSLYCLAKDRKMLRVLGELNIYHQN